MKAGGAGAHTRDGWAWRIGLALAITLVVGLWRLGPGDALTDRLERWTVDLRFALRGPWQAVEEVAIVAVDEAALARYGTAPALRGALAEALPGIAAAGARTIAIDFLFVERTAADGALAAALVRTGRTVVGVAGLNEPAPDPALAPDVAVSLERSAIPVVVRAAGATPWPAPLRLVLPTDRIAGAARLGHVNIERTPDRVARALPLAIEGPRGRLLPALSLAAVALAERQPVALVESRGVVFGDRSVPTGAGRRLVIDHPGPAGTVPTYRLTDVLDGGLPPGALDGRLVFVGATAESLRDVFVTPFGPDVAGVEVLAGVGAGLAQGRWIVRDGRTLSAGLALGLALCLGAGLSARIRGNAVALAAGLGVWLAGAGVAQAAFAASGWWLDATTLLAGLLAGTVAGAEWRYRAVTRDAREMRRERGNLARFVSPALADRLAREERPGFDRRAQEAGVLFVDMAGYTAMAEAAGPDRVAAFLAALHEAFEAAAAGHGGVVVDYQGDGAMIVFGLPDPGPEDAGHAIACAEALVDGAARLAPEAPDGKEPRLRASVHYGAVVAAVLGGRRQAVVTLTGDTVNVAARLQETAKAEGADLVASREALDAAGPATAVRFEAIGPVAVRGRGGRIEVWRRRSASPEEAPRG